MSVVECCECLWKFIFDLRLRESYIYLSYKICDCGVLKAGSRGRNRDWEAEATQNDRKNNDRKAINGKKRKLPKMKEKKKRSKGNSLERKRGLVDET